MNYAERKLRDQKQMSAPIAPPTIDQLTFDIRVWAQERGIDTLAPSGQYQKLVEEVGELGKAIMDNDDHEQVDAIGDTFITLVNLATTLDKDLRDSILQAFREIEHRTGRVIDGVFVKDE